MADDYSSDASTTGRLPIGGSVAGETTRLDNDWFKVHLEAGKPYIFTLSGLLQGQGSIYDLSGLDLSLLDAAGTLLNVSYGYGDGSSAARLLSVLAPASGDYFISVANYYGNASGTYGLSAVLQGPDDYAAGTGAQGALVQGQTLHAKFEVAGDVDWFKFHAEAGQHYRFTYANGSVLPSWSEIYDAGGKLLQGGSVVEPFSSGDYYIALQGNQAGDYAVTMNLIADDYSANLSAPGQLALGGQASGILQYQNDRDSFTFSMEAGHIYNLELDADSGITASRLSLLVYDGDDRQVNAIVSRGEDGIQHVTIQAAKDGVYRLTVGADQYWSGNDGHYTLHSLGVLVDDYGDTVATAAALDIGSVASGSIQTSQDKDVFKVDLQAGVAYLFKLDHAGLPGAGSPLSLSFLDSKGAALALPYSDSQGQPYVPTVSGSYYVSVGGSNGQPNPYTLAASLAADDYSANAATSGTLAVGGDKVSGALEFRGDRDWFAIDLNAGTTYWFSTAGDGDKQLSSGYINGTELRVFDAKGAMVATSGLDYGTSYPMLSFAAPTRGTYYLELASPSQLTGGYQVQAQIGTRDDFGNDYAHASTIVVDKQVSGRLELTGDKDVFKLSVVAGATYRIDVAAPVGGLPWSYGTTLALTDAQQGYVQQRTLYNGGNAITVLFDAAKSGDYYFTVSDHGDYGAPQQHGYTLNAISYGLDDFSAGSNTTGVLPVNGQLHGAIGYPDDKDWFKVHLEAGRSYVFDLQGTLSGGGSLNTANSSPGLSLTGPNGQTVATQGYNPGNEPRLRYTATSTGDFFLEAHGDGRTLGSYTVSAVQTTGDLTPPELLSLYPASGSDIRPESTIVLTFSETVALAPGNQFLLSGGSSPVWLSIGYDISAVGHTIVVNPPRNLQPGVSYTLQIPDGGIVDLAGNKYSGNITINPVAAASSGTDGNDYLVGKGDGQHLDGGKGIDSVYYDDAKTIFSVSHVGGDTFQVRGWFGAPDTLSGIERLIFNQRSMALDIDGHGGQAYRLYQAAFNRTPDEAGLGYWIKQVDGGQSLTSVAHDFIASTEFSNTYGAKLSDSAFVNQLYQNVLHRAGDAGGVAYWEKTLHDGGSRDSVLVAFSESAENQAALVGKIGDGFWYTPYG
jgi:hypothetical protein